LPTRTESLTGAEGRSGRVGIRSGLIVKPDGGRSRARHGDAGTSTGGPPLFLPPSIPVNRRLAVPAWAGGRFLPIASQHRLWEAMRDINAVLTGTNPQSRGSATDRLPHGGGCRRHAACDAGCSSSCADPSKKGRLSDQRDAVYGERSRETSDQLANIAEDIRPNGAAQVTGAVDQADADAATAGGGVSTSVAPSKTA